MFYRSLNADTSQTQDNGLPTKESLQGYWMSLWSNPQQHIAEAKLPK